MFIDDEKIGVVGKGIVGTALYEGFKDYCKVSVYDKFKDSKTLEEVCKSSSLIFICLPTPMKEDKIDLSIIDENIKQIVGYTDNTNKVIVIKSTVVPGTTLEYQNKYPKSIFAFNPEFLRESSYLQDFNNPDRTVIGTFNAQVGLRLLNLYSKRFPGSKIFRTDPTTAEMVKYAANCLLATIVLHNNIIYDICQALSINWEEVASMVREDRRFQTLRDYFFVTSNRGFGGKCLAKDIVALIGRAKELGVDISFIEKVWSENLRIRKYKDWEDIPWAVS